MKNIKKVRKTKINAFTLIELIAVLVILAIITLIVAPLLLNMIRRVKDVANKRSVDGYGRAVEYAMADYQLVHLAYPDSFDKLDIEYKGNKVECKTSRINPDYSIYLSECKVNGKLVKNDKEVDGYYHYGILKMTNIEYVDTYGKNLEDALKNYYDEHNEYPNDYTTLELAPLDKEVSCDVDIYSDGKLYLTKCSVNGQEVLDETKKDNYYHYGKKQYKIGDIVQYNNMDFYVIENSSDDSDSVTLLKDTPLTVEEVNLYGGAGTENNHVNKFTNSSIGTAKNNNGYGLMAYYTSETCGYINKTWIETECKTEYNTSDIKYVVDSWSVENINWDDLYDDENNVRLIKYEELKNNLGYGNDNNANDNVPTWIKNNSYRWWTMSKRGQTYVYSVELTTGKINHRSVDSILYGGAVRPVVTLKKSALE